MYGILSITMIAVFCCVTEMAGASLKAVGVAPNDAGTQDLFLYNIDREAHALVLATKLALRRLRELARRCFPKLTQATWTGARNFASV